MISTWLFLPFVQWLSSRFEKKSAYIFAAGSWSVLLLSTLLIPQGEKVPVYIVIALSGLGIAAIHLLPSAMLPDVIEVDELASQRRQEGIYFGISAFVNKLGQMITLTLLPLLLSWSGYRQPTANTAQSAQPVSVILTLRLLITVLPAILLVLSMIAAWFYPITRAQHRQTLRDLNGISIKENQD